MRQAQYTGTYALRQLVGVQNSSPPPPLHFTANYHLWHSSEPGHKVYGKINHCHTDKNV